MQVASLFLLFFGVMFVSIPLHVMTLIEHLISIEHLNLSQSMQEIVRSLLNQTFVTDVGRMLLGISSCFLLPSTLGYVGAVRESRLLLVLVRLCSMHHMYLSIFIDSTSHPSFCSGDWSLSSSFFFQLSNLTYTVPRPG